MKPILEGGTGMIWLKRVGYGVILWAIPFAAAIPMLPLQRSEPLVFKAMEVSIAMLTVSLLLYFYFRRIEKQFLREAVLAAATWTIVNWALDVVALLPFTHQSLTQYFLEIGIEYAASAVLVIAVGALLDRKLAKV
jgi:hypothetical protein